MLRRLLILPAVLLLASCIQYAQGHDADVAAVSPTRAGLVDWGAPVPVPPPPRELIVAATAPGPAAAPFAFEGSQQAGFGNALDCLTAAVYYEARSESTDGQRAVAQVVLNRARHPAFPNSVCGVVFQGSQRRTGCQFSFTCDGSMSRGRRDRGRLGAGARRRPGGAFRRRLRPGRPRHPLSHHRDPRLVGALADPRDDDRRAYLLSLAGPLGRSDRLHPAGHRRRTTRSRPAARDHRRHAIRRRKR